jgi:hypothetical protein
MSNVILHLTVPAATQRAICIAGDLDHPLNLTLKTSHEASAGRKQIPRYSAHKQKIAEQPSEQPFDENKNGSQLGCLASY